MKFKQLSFLILLLPSVCFSSEIYFSPDGGATDAVIKHINLSLHEIDVAVYSFTSGEIADALAKAAERGVKIRLIRDQIQSSNKNDENAFLKKSGVEIQIRTGKGRGIMHDKFAIFDGRQVLTGSFNWTENAERNNFENAFFTDEKTVVDAYEKQFEHIWSLPLPARSNVHHHNKSFPG